MKKLILLGLVLLLGACCGGYPLRMTEVEWNSLTKQEKIEARREEARLSEKRQLRYAIERQNRLKEKQINANINATNASANAANAAAAAAHNSTKVNNNINVVVANSNQNTNNNSNVNSRKNKKFETVKICKTQKQYDDFIKKGDAFMKANKAHQAAQMYKSALKFTCSKGHKIAANAKLKAAESKKKSSGNNGGRK